MDFDKIKEAFAEEVIRPKIGHAGEFEQYLLDGLDRVLRRVVPHKPAVEGTQAKRDSLARFTSPDPNERFPGFLAFLAGAGDVLLGEPKWETFFFSPEMKTITRGIIWPVSVSGDFVGNFAFRDKTDHYEGRIPISLLKKKDRRRGEQIHMSYNWESKERNDGHSDIPFP